MSIAKIGARRVFAEPNRWVPPYGSASRASSLNRATRLGTPADPKGRSNATGKPLGFVSPQLSFERSFLSSFASSFSLFRYTILHHSLLSVLNSGKQSTGTDSRRKCDSGVSLSRSIYSPGRAPHVLPTFTPPRPHNHLHSQYFTF
jgi:hypothetical protein